MNLLYSILVIIGVLTVNAQHIHEPFGRNHLKGIKRLRIRKIHAPAQVEVEEPQNHVPNKPMRASPPPSVPLPTQIHYDRERIKNYYQQVTNPNQVLLKKHVPTLTSVEPIFKRVSAVPIPPPASNENNFQRLLSKFYSNNNNQRVTSAHLRKPVNVHRVRNILPVARAAPIQLFHGSRELGVIEQEPIATTTLSPYQQRLARYHARWKKIGGLIGPPNTNNYYQRTRPTTKTLPIAQPVSWAHQAILTSTPGHIEKPTKSPFSFVMKRRNTLPPSAEFPTTPIPLPPSSKILPSREDYRRFERLKNGRNSHEFGFRRAYSEKIRKIPKIHGSVLEPPSDFEPFVMEEKTEKRLIVSENFRDGPNIIEDLASEPEDHRRRGKVPIKRFKFTNKLNHRPRLKIRRPGEQFAAGSRSRGQAPIELPELTPFDSSDSYPKSGREPLRIAHGHISREMFKQELPPAPAPAPRQIFPGEDSLPTPPPTSPTLPSSTAPPTTTTIPSTIAPTLPPTQPPPPPTETNPSSDLGDSAIGFGDIGPPPPGFGQDFNILGSGGNAPGPSTPPETTPAPTTPAPTTPTPTTPAPTTPAPTTPAPTTTQAPTTTPAPTKNPEFIQVEPPPRPVQPPENFVIPENSGLRVVTPPKEFVGGFGTSGKIGGSFGGGSGGFGGFGGGNGGPGPGSGPAPGSPGQAGPPEPDFFTGDSALSPNKKGPNGDGYGPPIFPGEAAPPPVLETVNVGGAAAGIPPPSYNPPSYNKMMVREENTATTVKPSALLSILSRADQGFNQALKHFEEGTPVETAAIDILEVALGSQKLDSQAKLLGHVDRTIGLDNLQRLQRWANTGGAFDLLKEEFVKFAKNFKPPDNALPTIPPQLEYLLQPSGK